MATFLFCETCCDLEELEDPAIIPSVHVGHVGVCVASADHADALSLLARHLHIRGLSRELAADDKNAP